MKKLILIAGLIAGLSAPAFAGANLVVNGDFSSPNTFGGWTEVASGSYGWYNNNDNIEIGNSGIYGLPCANAACQSSEVLTNHSPDTMYQPVSGLVVGDWYKVSYQYGGRPGADASMVASFGGTTLTTNTGSIGYWTSNTFSVKATATIENLTFAATALSGCSSCGAEVTNVAVSAPEVSTWAMMLAGFAGLGFVGYRRQKAGLAA
jgi:hypothetical protein